MNPDRPLAAAGHLFLPANGARQAAERLVSVGVRKIVIQEAFAVLELRGGTHIVVREGDGEDIKTASFDLMYDDIEAAQTLFRDKGFKVSDIKPGRSHQSFTAPAPEGYRIQVLDSHAGQRAV